MVLEVQDQIQVRAWFIHSTHPSVSSRGGRDRGVLRGVFYKGTHTIHVGSALTT